MSIMEVDMYWKLLVCFSCLVVFIGCSDSNQKTTPTEVAYNQRVSIKIPINSPTITKVSFEVGGHSVDFDGEALSRLNLEQQGNNLAFTFPHFPAAFSPLILELTEESYERGPITVTFADAENKPITSQIYAPYGSVVTSEVNTLFEGVNSEQECEDVALSSLDDGVIIKSLAYTEGVCFANLRVESNNVTQILRLLNKRTLETSNKSITTIASRNVRLGLNNGSNGYDPTCDQIAKWLKPASKNYNRIYQDTLLQKTSNQTSLEGKGVTVVLIGGGVSTKYLSDSAKNKVVAGYNFIGKDSSDTNDNFRCANESGEYEFIGHDTHIAQVVHDLAPEAAIMPLKVCGSGDDPDDISNSSCPSDKISQALLYLAKLEKQGNASNKVIVNLSLGGPLPDETMFKILAQSTNEFLVLASAGNHPDIPEHYPADYAFELDNVLSVAATGQNNNGWELAPFNRKHTLKAPGVNLCPESYSNVDLEECPVPSDASPYGGLTGTSFAAPVATGLAALYAEDTPLNQIPIRLLSYLLNP